MQLLNYVSGWMNLEDRDADLARTEQRGTALAERLAGPAGDQQADVDGVIRVRWSAGEAEAFSRKVAACLERRVDRYVHDCNFLD